VGGITQCTCQMQQQYQAQVTKPSSSSSSHAVEPANRSALQCSRPPAVATAWATKYSEGSAMATERGTSEAGRK
jgi:hypothetical protein